VLLHFALGRSIRFNTPTLFALAFCVFPKAAYVDEVTPALRRLKAATFGHDLVVLHEHDIRKKEGTFAMMSRAPREAFLDALSGVIEAAPFTLVAVSRMSEEVIPRWMNLESGPT
jgi:hypothetical protein